MVRKKEIPGSATGDHVPTRRAPPPAPAGMPQRHCSTRIQIRHVVEGFTSSSEKLCQFAVQLLLNPAVASIKFERSLPLLDYEVQIDMLVVDLEGHGRVAFDVVGERPLLDIDDEGLLLLALQSRGIRLVQIDHADIDAEPRATNCKLIWSHRDHPVPTSLETAITRALIARNALTARSLSTMTGVRDLTAEISALICQGVVLTDLSVTFGPTSVLHLASSAWRPPALLAGTSKRFGRVAP